MRTNDGERSIGPRGRGVHGVAKVLARGDAFDVLEGAAIAELRC
jgi:hypothetical protein